MLYINNQLWTLIHAKAWVHQKVIMVSKMRKTQNSTHYTVPHVIQSEIAGSLRVMSKTNIYWPICYIFYLTRKPINKWNIGEQHFRSEDIDMHMIHDFVLDSKSWEQGLEGNAIIISKI